MLTRRLFLGAALAAPAIVRASSLMKIWVPPRETMWVGVDFGDVRGDVTIVSGLSRLMDAQRSAERGMLEMILRAGAMIDAQNVPQRYWLTGAQA